MKMIDRLVPTRSPTLPPNKPTNMPVREVKPHIQPIWTRLSFKSAEISAKRTGREIKGIAKTSVAVNAAKVAKIHFSFEDDGEAGVDVFFIYSSMLSGIAVAR